MVAGHGRQAQAVVCTLAHLLIKAIGAAADKDDPVGSRIHPFLHLLRKSPAVHRSSVLIEQDDPVPRAQFPGKGLGLHPNHLFFGARLGTGRDAIQAAVLLVALNALFQFPHLLVQKLWLRSSAIQKDDLHAIALTSRKLVHDASRLPITQ